MTILQVGLIGERPPLSVLQTGLRIVIVLSAVGVVFVRRNLFERITLLTGAAAAGSSAVYGFGLRLPSLSAFRLLSHLVMYGMVAILAGRMVSRSAAPSKRELVWWVPVLLTMHNAEEALAFKSYLPRLTTLLPEPLQAIPSGLSVLGASDRTRRPFDRGGDRSHRRLDTACIPVCIVAIDIDRSGARA